ncbi:ABC transporter permease [Microbacterium trichothecenolyticum]|uniref:Ribose/xylose/arabinose/galactoside ABC-type transport system permease subunit n=1 Tax=Microbacterium trichothecenolyticum TaxID=69370 RepID=A0ABU0U0R1_MICTR|nr:ABC transporter permease [Microbacterium trichothecenolyticum]MDQ1124774.1 ribose/xylose/arabinose/galactoside ABC-type transport system permease subunit [Microbacterium trichothecenolyticum]
MNRRLSSFLLRPQTISNIVLLAALVALAVFFVSQSRAFLTPINVMTLIENSAALGIVAVPFALLTISGNVDFSIGSTAGLSATLTAVLVTRAGVPEAAAMGIALLVAAAVGTVNALLCVVLGFNPIIVTLGMLGVVRGGTLLMQQDQIFGIGALTEWIGSGDVLGVPVTVVIAIAVFVVGGLTLSATPFGRHVVAIGVNRQAAFLSALRVRAIPFVLYVVTSACAGLAGIVLMARLNGVSPGETGVGLEFQALTVVLLGGVAFAGGSGSIAGVLLAWLFLASLQNGLVLLHVTPYVQTVSAGVALVLAAALDRLGSTFVPRLQEVLAQRGRAAAVRTEDAASAAPVAGDAQTKAVAAAARGSARE